MQTGDYTTLIIFTTLLGVFNFTYLVLRVIPSFRNSIKEITDVLEEKADTDLKLSKAVAESILLHKRCIIEIKDELKDNRTKIGLNELEITDLKRRIKKDNLGKFSDTECPTNLVQ